MSADGEQGGATLVYCVIADDHSETTGRQWLVGTFTTAEEAAQAALSEREAKPGCDTTTFLGSIATPATDTPEVVMKAVNLAYDLLMEVEQTTSNVWWVNVNDPEVAVSDTLDALEEARFAIALAKHPTSPEDAA